MADRFEAGDEVIHVTASEIPEGVKGVVLGRGPKYYSDRWEVEYPGYPCSGKDIPGCKSLTSWLSRDTSIELTTEAALKKARKQSG